MILKTSKPSTVFFIAILIISIGSCKKAPIKLKSDLIASEYKKIQLETGLTDNGVPIKASNWSVEYVKDAVSGKMLQDKAGKQMVLNTFGTVEESTGWLKLEKKEQNNLLNISLKENFAADPRKFLIGILADGKRDELSFTQTRGEGYSIVDKE